MEINNLFEANYLFITKKYLLLFTVLSPIKSTLKGISNISGQKIYILHYMSKKSIKKNFLLIHVI